MNRRTFIASTAALALTPALSLPALAGGRKGTFKGQKGHITTGGVTVKDGKIILESNFSFDGAPDPRVGLGNGGKYAKNTDFAVLKKDKGKQSYTVPSNLNVADYDTVVIWCRKFSVPLGYAKLK
jgi:hypothetical protein